MLNFSIFFILFVLVHLSLSTNNGGDTLTFEFHTSRSHKSTYTVQNLEKIFENPNFDRNKRTVIYNYGFLQTVQQPDVRRIIDAYLQNGNFNFIIVNYNSILNYTVLVSDLLTSQ